MILDDGTDTREEVRRAGRRLGEAWRRGERVSAVLNIRANLSAETVRAFKAQAAARGVTQGEWLTLLVGQVQLDEEAHNA